MKNLVINIILSILLLAFYAIAIYSPIYEFHKMKGFSLLLFIVCCIILIFSGFIKKRILTPLLTITGYFVGLILGIVFEHKYFDPGGGAMSNTWQIWLIVFVLFVIVGILTDILIKRKLNNTK